MPVERDRALFEFLTDLERIADWIFRQVVEQLERELSVLHQWRRRWEEREGRSYIWSYGQLRRTHACQNLPENLRRETAASRTTIAVHIEPTVVLESIICNHMQHFSEARRHTRVPLVRLSSSSRRYARLRQYQERRWNADWRVVWRNLATLRTSDNRVHVRRRSPSHRVFFSCVRLRRTGLIWGIVMCIISYNSHSRLVFVSGFPTYILSSS